MREALIQSFQNLRANKLRSFLTMFGILWGMISVVVLSADEVVGLIRYWLRHPTGLVRP